LSKAEVPHVGKPSPQIRFSQQHDLAFTPNQSGSGGFIFDKASTQRPPHQGGEALLLGLRLQ
jgi:hypothetical protein